MTARERKRKGYSQSETNAQQRSARKKSGTYVLKPTKRSPQQQQRVAKETVRHNAAVQRRKAKLHKNAMARKEAAKYPRDPGARKVLSKPARKKAERTATRESKGTTEKYEQGQRNKAVAQLITGKRRMKYGKETASTKVPYKPTIVDTTVSTDRERKAVKKYLASKPTKGDKVLNVLDDVYEAGDKALDSVGPGIRKVLENVPTLKLNPEAALKRRGESSALRKSTKKESKEQTKALGKLATSPLKVTGAAAKAVREGAKQTRVAKSKGGKQIATLPGGRTVLAAGGIGAKPFTAPFKAVGTGGKALWYSDEVIKAAATGKSPKNIVKASQGKEKTSGQSIAKSLGIDPKKHKGANILVGGAVDLAAQAPLAAVTGGGGRIATTAAKQASTKAGAAALKDELKAAGVKKAKDLSPEARARIQKKAHKAGEDALAHATAKYGKQHDVNVGIDFKKPFSNKRVTHLKGLKQSTGLAAATTKGRKKLTEIELKGGKKGKVVTKARDATNTVHIKFNAKAGSRHQSGLSDSATKHAGRVTRGRTEIHEKDAADLEESLNQLQKHFESKGKDWPTEKKRIFKEVEDFGPDAPSLEARHWYAVSGSAHKKLVDEGLDQDFAGQRHTPYDGGKGLTSGKNNAAKKDAETVRRNRQQAGQERRQARMVADAARRDPRVGVKVRQATSDEQAFIDGLKTAEKDAKGVVKVTEDRVKVLEKRHKQYYNRLRVLSRSKPKGNVDHLVEHQAELQATIERMRVVEQALKRVYEKKPKLAKQNFEEASRLRHEAEDALDASLRSATKGRVSRPYNAQEKAAMEAAEAKEAIHKGYEQRRTELVHEIKMHPGTDDIKGTTALYDKWIAEADKIGAKDISKRLKKLKAEKIATPAFHTPRPKLTAKESSPADSPVWTRNVSEKPSIRHARENRTLKVDEAMEQTDRVQKKGVEGPDAPGTPTHDFSNRRLANTVKKDNIDAERSKFWQAVRDNVEDERDRVITHKKDKEGRMIPTDVGGYYVIDKRGPSQKFTSEIQAKRSRKDKDQKFDPDARIVYLTDRTKELIIKEAAPNRREISTDGLRRSMGNVQGQYRKVLVSTLFNRVQNAVGDTTNMSIYGGRLKHMKAGTTLAGPKGIISKEARIARGAERWLENTTLRDGVPISAKAAKFRNKTIPGGTATYGEYLDEHREFGVHETGLIRGDVEDQVISKKGSRQPTSLPGKFGAKWTRMVSTMESAPRSGAYISAREAGLTKKQAFEAANDALFDYTRRSSVESMLTHTFMPFIVWRGRNAAKLTAYYTRNPGKIKQHTTVFNTLAQTAGYDSMSALMEDLGEFTWNLPIPVPGTKGGTVSVGIPVGDIHQIQKQVRDGSTYKAAYSNVVGGKLIAAIVSRGMGDAGNEYSQPAGFPLDKAKGVPVLNQILGLHQGEDIRGNKRTMLGAIPSAAMGLTPETSLLQRTAGSGTGKEKALGLTKFATGVAYNPRRPGQGEIDRTAARIKDIELELIGGPTAARRKALNAEKWKLIAKRKKLYAAQDKALGRKSKKSARTGGGSGGGLGGGSGLSSGSGLSGGSGLGSGSGL